MNQLKLRISWPLLIALLLFIGGLNYGLPLIYKNATLVVPVVPLFIIEMGIILSSALLFYDEASPLQALAISGGMLTIALVLIIESYFLNPGVAEHFHLRPGSQAPVFSLNWIFLITINLSVIAVSKAIFVLERAILPGKRRNRLTESDR